MLSPQGARGHEGRKHMWPGRQGFGGRPTAASCVSLVALANAVTGSVGDPYATLDFGEVMTNRCSDFDLSGMANARNCGAPLSSPCFDFSRCRDGPTVYVYDQECSLADSDKIDSRGLHNGVRHAAHEKGVLAETYESACFFISVDRRESQCATTAPLWNEGRNHVMFDLFDESRDKRPSYSGSYAIEAATSQHTCYYRSGYDISVPHCPQVVSHELHTVPPDHRRYFLTFRGTLHLKFHGSEERSSVLGLHDESQGVIVAEKCVEGDSRWRREAAESCDALLPRYNAYDYQDLMNCTFGLVPAGASPGTYRLGEVISAGSIPVIVARDYVKPFSEEVDWSEFSFTFSPDEVPDILRTLRSVPPGELKKMQEKALEAYWKIYGRKIYGGKGYCTIIDHVIDIMVRRIGHH